MFSSALQIQIQDLIAISGALSDWYLFSTPKIFDEKMWKQPQYTCYSSVFANPRVADPDLPFLNLWVRIRNTKRAIFYVKKLTIKQWILTRMYILENHVSGS